MRVLHFYKAYAPDSFGGTETVIGSLARCTAPYGIDTEVLSLSRSPAQNSRQIDGHWAHKAHLDFEFASTGFSLSAFSMFARMARDFDLIHYHFPWPVMDLAHFLARVRKPTLVTYHSDIVRQKQLLALYRPLMHVFLNSVTAIVATSPDYLQSSVTLQRYRHKVSVIPIGARDLTRQAKPSGERRFAGRFFLFVGALRYYKGLRYLLDAAEQTGYPVVIAGKGELSAELAGEVARRRLGNVHLLGEVSEAEKAALLDQAYAFTFPSHLRSEAFGVALLEAAEFSCPMISCALGTGTSYVNIDGETGLVVPPGNAAALAGAMRLLWENPDMAQGMGRKARRRYEANFTEEVMAASYASLYHRLVAASPLYGAGGAGQAGPGSPT